MEKLEKEGTYIMKIYLVRHGETDGNVRNLYYGNMDLPMNANGMEQVENVAQILAGVPFDSVYTSNLERAETTAEIILQNNCFLERSENNILYPHMSVMPSIKELNFGDWEGLTYQEVMEAWPKEFELWGREWKTTRPPHGESFNDFFIRCREGLAQIIEETKGQKNILIAAHNGTFRCMLAAMLDMPIDGTWHFDFEQGAYTLIEYTDGYFVVRRINSREVV